MALFLLQVQETQVTACSKIAYCSFNDAATVILNSINEKEKDARKIIKSLN